mmetsp:Transcript_30855/g.71272  ORF Transcript_30855/g.71272 Transcript_30855/m.71272 type:complete len:927 (+) Transcript_30855:67-2847(+)
MGKMRIQATTWLKGLVKGSDAEAQQKSSTSQGSKSEAAATTATKAPTSDASPLEEAKKVCTSLLQMSCGDKAAALFRPLGGSWSLIYEAVVRQTSLPPAAAEALSAAAEFVKGGKARELQLQFALMVHTDKDAMCRFMSDVNVAIRHLASARTASGVTDPLLNEEALLEQWQSDVEALRRRCCEIWELYMYFVFLDVKGDLAMLRLTARQLQNLLEMSPKSLVANLCGTGRWAEPALMALARGMARGLFERRHRQALGEWHSALHAAMSQACETAVKGVEVHGGKLKELKVELHRQQALQFWNHYFQNSACVAWWDFADVFQECFCGSSCPSDVLECLRRHVAKPCRNRVALHAWESFVDKHGPGAPELLSYLVDEVLQNLPSTVFRTTAPSASTGASTDDREVLALFSRPASGTVPFAGRKVPTLPRELPALQSVALGNDDAWSKVAPDVGGAYPPPGVLSLQTPHDPSRPMDLEAARAAAARETPLDNRRTGPVEPGEEISWEDFQSKLHMATRPWWQSASELVEQSSATSSEEPIQVQAMRAVNGTLAPTRKALVLRVSSGTLGDGRPRIQCGENAHLPAIVITPNDTNCSMTTKFGRGRTEGGRTLQPHIVMTEPIASRSHFSVVYDQARGKYQVMDAGSKWGTFKKITRQGRPVSCGDWIRIGNAELVVRFCGGGCSCQRHHARHRLHGLGIATKVFGSSGFPATHRPVSESHMPWRRQWTQDLAAGSDEDRDEDISEKALGILGSASRAYGTARKNWSSSFEQLCRDVNPTGEGALRPRKSGKARSSALALPASPLEIDFISGPRIGERVMITDRMCTIGRGDACTIQLSDPTLANVSRVHCSFRLSGGRWWLCDEGSTNGTWSRLSCALEPSTPQDIEVGETILAGVQELKVEEAELSRWCIPSPVSFILAEMVSSERR